jgi:hypothetical protein
MRIVAVDCLFSAYGRLTVHCSVLMRLLIAYKVFQLLDSILQIPAFMVLSVGFSSTSWPHSNLPVHLPPHALACPVELSHSNSTARTGCSDSLPSTLSHSLSVHAAQSHRDIPRPRSCASHKQRLAPARTLAEESPNECHTHADTR